MNSNPNNIFFTLVTRSNNGHILENDFHLIAYSGNKHKFQWSYLGFPFTMEIILVFR